MNIWHKLSIEKKCFTVFIIQYISIILVFLILDIDFDINFCTLLSFVIFFIGSDLFTKKTFFIFNIIILLLFLPDNCFNLMQNFNIDYNQLKNYSGKNIYASTGGKSVTAAHLALKKDEDEKRMYFTCSPVSKDNDDCYKELSQYFGYGDSRYGNHISVKYAEIYHFQMLTFIPFIQKDKVIYEIKHNDKIIYGYDYFINKFSQQRKNLLIFVVYVILNSVVFCFFYHWIQKDFLKHSQ